MFYKIFHIYVDYVGKINSLATKHRAAQRICRKYFGEVNSLLT